MFESPEMLVDAAEKAGMKVPQNADDELWDVLEFPHFYVFCRLGRNMKPGEHWEIAKIVAACSLEDFRNFSPEDFLKRFVHSV